MHRDYYTSSQLDTVHSEPNIIVPTKWIIVQGILYTLRIPSVLSIMLDTAVAGKAEVEPLSSANVSW